MRELMEDIWALSEKGEWLSEELVKAEKPEEKEEYEAWVLVPSSNGAFPFDKSRSQGKLWRGTGALATTFESLDPPSGFTGSLSTWQAMLSAELQVH